MKAVLAIAAREVSSRRFVVLAGSALGIVPLVLSWLTPWPGITPAEVRAGASLLIAGVLALAVPVMTGSSVFGSDLSERRIGFYFARPVPAFSIWAGKVGGGLVVVHAAVLASLVPAWLAGSLHRDSWMLLAILTAPGLLFLIANAVSTSVRSRSPWIAVDFAAGLITSGLLWLAFRRTVLQLSGAGNLGNTRVTTFFQIAAGTALAVLVLALLAGSYLQTASGRVDLARAHRSHSIGFWGLVLTFSLFADVSTRWLVNASVDSLAAYWVRPGPSGTWVWVTGSLPGLRSFVPHTFLIEPESGRNLEIRPAVFPWSGASAISQEGNRAVWVKVDPLTKSRGLELVAVDLTSPDPLSGARRYPLSGFPTRLVLSRDGALAALQVDETIQVLESASGKIVGSFRSPFQKRSIHHIFFPDDGVLRLFGETQGQESSAGLDVEILDFDLRSRSLVKRGVVHAPDAREVWLTLGPGETHLVLRARGLDRYEVSLHDGVTGSSLRSLARGEGRPPAVRFFSGDRLALLEKGSGTLRILPLLGGTEQRITLREGRSFLTPGVEARPGALLCPWVKRKEGSPVPEGVGTVEVDLASGNLRDLGGPGGLEGALPALQFHSDMVAPGSPATRLIQSRLGGLGLLTPDLRGEKRVCRGEEGVDPQKSSLTMND